MSKEATIQELRELLGADPPPGIAALAPEHLGELAASIREARRRQAQALDQAGERALARIPRLLRGPVRKVAGG